MTGLATPRYRLAGPSFLMMSRKMLSMEVVLPPESCWRVFATCSKNTRRNLVKNNGLMYFQREQPSEIQTSRTYSFIKSGKKKFGQDLARLSRRGTNWHDDVYVWTGVSFQVTILLADGVFSLSVFVDGRAVCVSSGRQYVRRYILRNISARKRLRHWPFRNPESFFFRVW